MKIPKIETGIAIEPLSEKTLARVQALGVNLKYLKPGSSFVVEGARSRSLELALAVLTWSVDRRIRLDARLERQDGRTIGLRIWRCASADDRIAYYENGFFSDRDDGKVPVTRRVAKRRYREGVEAGAKARAQAGLDD